MKVGMMVTSSNFFANSALKNPPKENKMEVIRTVKRITKGLWNLRFVKNREVSVTRIPTRIPLTTPPKV